MTQPSNPMTQPLTPVTTMPYLPLGMIATTVDAFSGKENIKLYFDKLEQRAKLDDWTEDQTLKLFKYRLSGEAMKFLKSDPSFENVGYKDLKAKFIKQFSTLALPGELLSKLNKMFQRHDESVANYATRLKMLGADILTEDLASAAENEKAGIRKQNARLLMTQFRVGLKKELLRDLGIACMREPDAALDRLIELSKIAELNQSILKGRTAAMETAPTETTPAPLRDERRPPRSQMLCYRCHQPGHFRRDCRVNLSKRRDQERDTPAQGSWNDNRRNFLGRRTEGTGGQERGGASSPADNRRGSLN